MIRTSRSKIVSAHVCRRYRYLKYHYGGGGLELVSGSLPAVSGQLVHDAFRDISLGVTVDAALATAGARLRAQMQEAAPLHPTLDHEVIEQTYVVEGLVRAFHKARQPLIAQEFDLIHVEKEMEWELAPGVIMPLRMDRLERRKSDGMVFIRDFKTTSMAGMEWVRKWERDHQILAYTQAASELIGEPVGGMIIEGLVRGKKKRESGKTPMFPGQRIQQSPLCYVYRNDRGEVSPYYQRGRGWEKVSLWEIGITPEEWIDDRLTTEEVSDLFIAPVPPISPNRGALERWRRQHASLELQIAHAADVVEANKLAAEKLDNKVIWLTSVDQEFPQNQDACYKYGEDYPCEFDQVCYNGQVEEDPIGSGLYAPRKDHHGDEAA